MDSEATVLALGALAHAHRLALFRLLVARGPEGLPAGEIAERLGVPPSSLTFHTRALLRAGLIRQLRSSRQLIYSADFDAMRALVGFLTEACCVNASDAAGAAACAPAPRAHRRRA